MARSRFSRSGPMMLTFPPFSGMIRKLIIANVAVYFALLLLHWIAPAVAGSIFLLGALTPTAVTHGYIWQLVTYSFLQAGILQVAFDMLSLWFIGAYLETSYGTRWITELYFVSVIGAAVTTIIVSYSGIFHMTPNATTYGSVGGIFGLMAAFAVLLGEQEFMLFPLPFNIRAKYLVLIWMLIALAGLMQGPSGFAYIAYLGGALFGYLYVKVAPRGGYAAATSNRLFSFRNGYYRWKRRRTARKFEVYMHKHGRDVELDAQGRLIDPDRKKDPNDRKWMN